LRFGLGLVTGAHGSFDTDLHIDRLDARNHAVDAGATVIGQFQSGAAVEDFHPAADRLD